MAKSSGHLLHTLVIDFWPMTLAFCISFVLLWKLHPFFSLLIFVWISVYLGLIGVLFIKKSIKYSMNHSLAETILKGKIVDSITNIMTVKLFSRYNYEKDEFEKYQKEEIVTARTLTNYLEMIRIFQAIASNLLIALMLLLVVYGWSKNWFSIGDMVFVTNLSMSIMSMTWYMAALMIRFVEELGIAKEAFSMIITPHDITDAPQAKPMIIQQGEIRFEKVCFQYPNGKEIFRNLNVTIHGGEKVGLVGYSGSGKTTFANLILRYFDISSGAILIDGQNIANVTQESLREKIAMIPQESTLFHRTLFENIRYGRLEANEEDVIDAARKAFCHDFIATLPDGYHTVIGERGAKLSGGQRQRIAIARAILKDAPILILDEATSALDSATEKKIQQSLDYLMKGRTSLIIAHRLSTLAEVDRILVFKDGEIIEDGNHAELLQKQAYYAHLWHMQAGGFLPEHPS